LHFGALQHFLALQQLLTLPQQVLTGATGPQHEAAGAEQPQQPFFMKNA
jgi:hypothetical protein